MPNEDRPRIDKEIREGIGKFLIAAMGTTDPGMKIQWTAAVIGAISGTLRVVLDREAPPGMADLIGQILVQLTEYAIREEQDEDAARAAATPLLEMLVKLFHEKNENETRAILELFRDFRRMETLKLAWKRANSSFANDPSSWVDASARLADIHPIIWEIAVRHQLIAMPEMIPMDFSTFLADRKRPDVKALMPVGSVEEDWNV